MYKSNQSKLPTTCNKLPLTAVDRNGGADCTAPTVLLKMFALCIKTGEKPTGSLYSIMDQMKSSENVQEMVPPSWNMSMFWKFQGSLCVSCFHSFLFPPFCWKDLPTKNFVLLFTLVNCNLLSGMSKTTPGHEENK